MDNFCIGDTITKHFDYFPFRLNTIIQSIKSHIVSASVEADDFPVANIYIYIYIYIYILYIYIYIIYIYK